ncbi:MAG: RHS domain-containing protein [Rhodocyclaceae bacterium]|nr:RHS domain-containing protein [Rhodocyclaceae bacterium]MCA3059167.1 RHS domain-containing protein [Rhodocyclaceae bacterium]MCA3068620.1 RHS domain-containing protein [Rhodocyclaceae bacterium]MCA6466902.1 RHS domain-containing protein [Chitinophagaceae bacterium]
MPNNTWGTAPQWKRDHAGQSGATDVQGSANSNGITHYVHVDHLGTSQRLTNTQGETTWRAVSEAFGKTFIDTTLAPATTGTTTNNLRFPGQYEDPETGTHYNYFRDYDPSTGRYVQSDPIGLRGGINTYAYVKANPLSKVDLFGLSPADPFGEGGKEDPMMYPDPSAACKKDECPNPVTINYRGICRSDDEMCGKAMKAAGIGGRYYPEAVTYSLNCLLKLGIGVKATSSVAGTVVISRAAAAGLTGAAEVAAVANNPLTMTVAGLGAADAVLEHCRCKGK